MKYRLMILACMAPMLQLAAQDAAGTDALRQELMQQLERQRAAYTADMAANRDWMQQITREFENQNALIRQLRDELTATGKELDALRNARSGESGELARVRAELNQRIDAESAARRAADEQLVRNVSGEIARAATTQAPAPVPAPSPGIPTIEYKVEPGDTLSAIATAFGTSITTLKSLNGLASDVIRVGQKLRVPAP